MLALLRAHIKVFFADRVAAALTFIIPVFMIFVFGSIFGGTHADSSGIRLALLNLSDAPVAARISAALDTSRAFTVIKQRPTRDGQPVPFDTASIQDYVRNGHAPAALVLPPDAFTDTSTSLKACVYYDPRNDVEMQIVQGMLQKIIMQQTPGVFMTSMMRKAQNRLGKSETSAFTREIQQTVSRYFPQAPTSLDSLLTSRTLATRMGDSSAASAMGSIVNVRLEQVVGKDVENPMPTRNVGGWAMMFLLFALSGVANVIIDERRNAVFGRMLAAPFSRDMILWSRYLYATILGTVQLVVLFVAGHLLFGVDVFPRAGLLLLVIVGAAASATGFGMLLASFCKTVAQAGAIGMVVILTMSSVGGAWFPTSLMPATVQALSKLSIVYWAMEAFMTVLWRHGSFLDVAPSLAVLGTFAVITIAISKWRFARSEHLF